MKHNLKTLFVLGVFVVMSLVVAQRVLAQDAGIKPIKLRAASPYNPPGISMEGDMFKAWQEEVTKRSKGAITFETYYGSSIAAPAEHIDVVKKGTVDLAQIFYWYTPGRFPISDLEYVFPFGPTDPAMVVKALRKMRSEFPQFEQDDVRENIIMLSDTPGGVYNFMSRKPIKAVDDFKGEKVSLVGRYFGRWLPPGATAVVRPMTDRYDMLRTGVVNIDFMPWGHFYAFKMYEVAKYYIAVNISSCTWAPIVMNLDAFKKFSPEVQKMLVELGPEMEMMGAKETIPKWFDKSQTKFREAGVNIISFPDAEKEKWARAVEDIPAEWAAEVEAKGYPGFKIVQRWQEITSELGFQWFRKWGIKK